MPPVTRSASGALAKKATRSTAATTAVSEPVESNKRKATGVATPAPQKRARKNANPKVNTTESTSEQPEVNGNASVPVPLTASQAAEDAPVLMPAILTFSFDDATRHLISADRRFSDVFGRLKCKPFEHLERVDPFRTLANSIMGQQISWLAARSIVHKFVRLFDPSLPEKPTDHSSTASFFPSARQVAGMDLATLKSAGLSGRKAEYVSDLASRFVDGRLSTEKLLAANDEELYEMLTAVRGIGRWTVDMFAIFSLRRPDILPVSDLGVQRGLLRWVLSLHTPTAYPLTISPEKLPKDPGEEPQHKNKKKADDEDVLPVAGGSNTHDSQPRAVTPDLSSIPPAPAGLPATPVRNGSERSESQDTPDTLLPTPFTPSIDNTLNMSVTADESAPPPPLPEGLTPGVLKSRLQRNKVKGALLTPKEMEELTGSWRPYRSLGVYYMWALAEPPK